MIVEQRRITIPFFFKAEIAWWMFSWRLLKLEPRPKNTVAILNVMMIVKRAVFYLQDFSQPIDCFIDPLSRNGQGHADVAFPCFPETIAGSYDDIGLIQERLRCFHRV